jgi:hypothetical protein
VPEADGQSHPFEGDPVAEKSVALEIAWDQRIGAGLFLAIGVGGALGVPTIAGVSWSSCRIAQVTPRGHDDRVVISAGVNDVPGRCVAAIRAKINAGLVVWIRPINGAGPTIDRLAAAHGDVVITYALGRDHIHPRSYGEVAAAVRRAWGRRGL